MTVYCLGEMKAGLMVERWKFFVVLKLVAKMEGLMAGMMVDEMADLMVGE